MPRPRDPFNHALADLRARVMQGVYPPGRPVVIVEEARRLGLSPTPVREALACLTGEGLLERATRAGYAAPRLDAALLRDRFWVRGRCLTMSLALTADLPAGLPDGVEAGLEALFDRLVRATGNRALTDLHARVDAQLRMLAAAEARVFEDVAAEAAALIRLGAEGPRPALASAVETYHQRRIEAAAVLVLALERSSAPVADPSSVREGG